MDDPWDVKSVRLAGQYTSCMKLNGVPLLPPVLSKECRKEMQYYKLLAKEVEKRISILKPYIEDSDDSIEGRTDAPEISGNEQNYVNHNASFRDKDLSTPGSPKLADEELEIYDSDSAIESSKFVVDFSLCINQTNVHSMGVKQRSPSPPIDVPERDYNCINKTKELILDTETNRIKKIRDTVDISFSINKEITNQFATSMDLDEPKSISSKSFTGSLNDLYTESIRENGAKLTRQRSYTVLNPSPQLLAHLEVQSLNTGIEMSNISMSESLSNLSSPNKKRRSWDLESAKVKWSSMALELRQKHMGRAVQSANNKEPQRSPQRGSSVAAVGAPPRGAVVKATPKSEPIQRRRSSPLKHVPSNKNVKEQPSLKMKEVMSPKSPHNSPKPHLISESENPAAKVRELYEKIQNQQLIQMASLVEKQKREQILLQQVFEEQNNLLYKQLKTICPKSPIEAKEAWCDKRNKPDRGPVSLSQLMDQKPPNVLGSPPALADTNKYIEHCNNALKRSRTLTNSLQKTPNSKAQSPTRSLRSSYHSEGSRTRTHSPAQRNTSRRLNYETSASSEKENEPMLTDRTNDTMADLNVTFPSDSDEVRVDVSANHAKDVTVIHANSLSNATQSHSTDSAIRCMERTIQESINGCRRGLGRPQIKPEPTPKQRAAATCLVAHARGFLVRRLFRTERVQTTVQTIKDALLCALQLHQDREGIRGADVDLHRRLIQQITAACYSLHDTFISSTAAERCAMIATDRGRRRALAAKPPALPSAPSVRSTRTTRTTRDIMSQSHCGAFPARPKRSPSASLMTQSSYESYNPEKARARYMPSPRRRPWR